MGPDSWWSLDLVLTPELMNGYGAVFRNVWNRLPAVHLAPSDLHSFWPLYKHLDSKWYATDVKQAVPSSLLIFYIDSFCVGIQSVMALWEKCLNVNDEYVEVWCVLSAMCLMYFEIRPKFTNQSLSYLKFWNIFVVLLELLNLLL
jgi:hypothetical protein